MTLTEQKQDDLLIAEFVNAEVDEDQIKDVNWFWVDLEGHFFEWNNLMPVVEQIYGTGLSGGVTEDLRTALMSADVYKAFQAVVEFIKWYNQDRLDKEVQSC